MKRNDASKTVEEPGVRAAVTTTIHIKHDFALWLTEEIKIENKKDGNGYLKRKPWKKKKRKVEQVLMNPVQPPIV